MEKIRIDVPVFNRQKITELVLMQLFKTKAPNDEIYIYNDGSTEYDDAWLSQWGKVIRYTMPLNQDRWRNIHTIRSRAFRDFVQNNYKPENNFDFLYMTDNDAFHDPSWRSEFIKISEEANVALCGYLSNFMFQNYDYYRNQINATFNKSYKIIQSTGGGISIFLNKDKVQTILNRMGHTDMHDMWDCMTWGYLNNTYAVPAQSLVEHFGKGGLHHNDWDFEKAINPTLYLQQVRPFIIDYLEDKISKNEVIQKI